LAFAVIVALYWPFGAAWVRLGDVEAADRRMPLAIAMADEAGRLLRTRFRARIPIELKSDRSPVSEADVEVEAALASMVEAGAPGDGFRGEESAPRNADARCVWVVDPIDGTRAFLAGLPTFVTLIALLVDDRPVLGVIDQPITGDRWIGCVGKPTTHGGRAVRTRACPDLAHALLGATDPSLLDIRSRDAFGRLAGATRTRVTGGDGLLYGLLASGHIDVVCESPLALHDWAAVVPVVTGAGGWIGDWGGAPLTPRSDGRVLAVGDPSLTAPALAALEGT
jgi:inositol-phosphate phosphatase / L-galactose 1-phosphate phosphatase / histidinol-phosphatase